MASTDGNTEGASPLSVVCNFWREFDLESRRPQLDELGLKIAEYQEDAQQNRRRLAEVTREFKRHSTSASTTLESALKDAFVLTKQYQEEVDRQTKRAKHAESAFLELYQKLYEAPDPAPALTLAFETASRVTELEAANRKIATELTEYRTEAASIRNQDLTIRKLEEKARTLEAQLATKEEEVAEVQQRAVAEADAARLAAMQQREAELAAALAEATSSLAVVQRLHASSQNQLFAIQSRSEEEQAGRTSELELASAELERAQERLSALEREKASLKAQLAQSHDKAGASNAAPTAGVSSMEESLRQELNVTRELTSRLRSEVSSLQSRLEEGETMWDAHVSGLRATLAATEQHAAALEAELAMRPTNNQMEELRQQLRVLQAVGYNSLPDMDGSAGGSSAGGGGAHAHNSTAAAGAGALGTSSLEALLMAKNRHLEHELTMARLRLVDLGGEQDTAQSMLAELQAELDAKQHQVERLEEDLLAVRKAAAAVTGGGASAAAGSGSGEDGDVGDDGHSSMVRVLCSQRDRLRQRCHELEEELGKSRLELQEAKKAAAAAKADNIALIERLKYVNTYTPQHRGGGDVEAARGADVEKRYNRLYEDGLNPFREFQGQQRERTRKQMMLPDQIMYMFGQAVFGSQSARIFTFCYLSALHLLVFILLARFTHHTTNAIYDHTQQVLNTKETLGMHTRSL